METAEAGQGQVGAFSFHSKHADTLSVGPKLLFPRPKECYMGIVGENTNSLTSAVSHACFYDACKSQRCLFKGTRTQHQGSLSLENCMVL